MKIRPIDRALEWARDRGWDQTEFAVRLGVDRANVTNWKSRGLPSNRHAQVAALFGKSVDELLGMVRADLQASWDIDSPLEPAGEPREARQVPIVGTAKLGNNGYYEELRYPAGHGDGTIDSYSPDDQAYALRVKGDSMHPAIRNGSFIVAEPSRACVPGEYVVLVLADGQKMVKELVIERPDEIVVESVNGGARLTIEKSGIEKMHPVGAIVAASKWRPA